MSLPDLRDHLHQQADEIDIDGPPPIAAVRRRAAGLKRRRNAAAVAAGTAVAVLAAVAIGSGGWTTATDEPPAATPTKAPSKAATAPPPDGLPSKAVPPRSGDYVKGDVRYRATVGEDRLAAAAVGSRGQGSVSFTWTPTSTAVDFRIFCTLPSGAAARVVLRINGKLAKSAACGPFVVPEPGELSGARLTRNGLGLRVGRSARVTATVVDGKNRPLTAPGQLVGAGIYTLRTDDSYRPDGDVRPAKVSEVELPYVIEHQGHRYEWSGALTAPLPSASGPAEVTVSTPSFQPFLVVFGTIGTRQAHSFELAGVSGDRAYTFRPADGPTASIRSEAVRAQAAGEVTVRIKGRVPARGELFLATYLPAS